MPNGQLNAVELAIEEVEREAWLDIYRAAPEAIRSGLGLASKAVGDGSLFICKAIDHIQFNRLAGLGLKGPASADDLTVATGGFVNSGVKNWIVHCPEPLSGLAGLCESQGLKPHDRTWVKFTRGPGAVEAKTDFEIREALPADATAFGTAAAGGFGLPPIAGQWIAPLAGRPGWRCFVAFDGAAPVAGAALYISGMAAWFGIGATLPSHRNRGAQSALLASRIHAATAAGCTLLTTETGIPHPGEKGSSYKNIQAAGFRIVYRRLNYCLPG